MLFADYCFKVDPSYIFNWHFDVIHLNLQDLFDDKIRRLMLLTAPRHGKSRHSCELFPSYWLGERDDSKVMLLTAGESLSGIFGRNVKRIIESPVWQNEYQKSLTKDSQSKMEFSLTDGSEFYAIGKGGQVYGKGGDLIVGDDLIKDWIEANSVKGKESNYWFYRTVAETRLEDQTSKMLMLNTRWRKDDLPGRLIEEEGGLWRIIVIPGIAEADEIYVGQSGVWHRKKGTAIWPVRYPIAELKRRRKVMGREFTGSYQQNPTVGEGEDFKRSFWCYYKHDEMPEKKDIKLKLMSLDTAFKEEEANDYSVVLSALITMDNRVLLTDLSRDRLRFSGLKKEAEKKIKQHRPEYVLIEDKGSGTSLIQELEDDKDISRKTVIEGIPKKWSKKDYAKAVAYIVELGRVYLPEEAQWIFSFIDEHAEFPNGTHDDQVDCLIQLLMYIKDNDLLTDLAELTDITAI